MGCRDKSRRTESPFLSEITPFRLRPLRAQEPWISMIGFNSLYFIIQNETSFQPYRYKSKRNRNELQNLARS